MKTKILIAFILLFSFGASCTPDELPSNTNCSCGTITEKVTFYNPTFTLIKVKNNCSGEVKQKELTGTQPSLHIGDEYCNN